MSEAVKRIGPTKERIRQAAGQVDWVPDPTDKDTNPNYKPIVRMMDGSLLEKLRKRDAITEAQYAAGEHLYSDYARSGLFPVVPNPMRDIVDNGGQGNTDSLAHHLHEFNAAMKDLGTALGHAVRLMVLGEMKPEQYGREFCGYRQRGLAIAAAMTLLRVALNRLDVFYNGNRKRRTVSAHAPDYRPGIDNPVITTYDDSP